MQQSAQGGEVVGDLKLEQCTVDLGRRRFTGARGAGVLTETEARLLAYLAERPSRDVSRDELLVEVWGLPVTSLSRCVDTAMRRLRAKLEAVPRRPRHLLTRHGTGYRFEPLSRPSVAQRAASLAPTLLGRADELAAIVEVLRSGARWVTVHGPAGIGKTAVTRGLLRLADPALPARLGFASLTAADDLAGVVTAVSEAAQVPVATATPTALAAALGPLGPGLLVLDTAEHVVDAVRVTVDAALTANAGLVVLVTSRQRIGHDVEHLVEIGPLVPADAAALFRTRALEHGALDVEDADARRVAEQLDGVPLALELAAARARILSPGGVADRLASSAGRAWLGTRGPVGDARHRSLVDALTWSWALLDPSRQHALGRLAVFPTAFSIDAAEAVLEHDEPLDLIEDLMEASWLAREGSRLRLLDAVAAFVRDARPDAVDRARAPLRRWCLALCDAWSEVRIGDAGVQARQTLAAELEVLQAAHADAVAARDAEAAAGIASGIDLLFRQRGPSDVHLQTLEAAFALRRAASDARHATLARQYGDLLRVLGRAEEGVAVLDDAVEVARASGDRAVLARALVVYAAALGRNEAVRTGVALREGLQLAEAEGLADWAAIGWLNRAPMHLELGDHESAVEAARRGREWLARSGNPLDVARADEILGGLLCQRGEVAEGLPRLREAVGVLRDAGMHKRELTATLQVGAAALDAGALDEAEAAFDHAASLAERLQNPRLGIIARASQGIVAYHRGELERAEAILARAQLDAQDRLGGADALTRAWRIVALAGLGRTSEAASLLGTGSVEASSRPDAVVVFDLARAFVEPDAAAEAIAAAEPWQDRSTSVRVLLRALNRSRRA